MKNEPTKSMLPLFLASMLFGALPAQAGFSFDEMEELEQSEQDELLAEAKKAARAWNFSKAENYLSQAEQKGFAPGKIKTARDLISRMHRERDAHELAEKKRQEADERNHITSTGRTGVSSNVNYVIVNVSSNGYFDKIKNLSLSGCGSVSNNSGKSVSITKGYNDCLGGTYSFSMTYISSGLAESTKGRVCSGSFNISGRRRNVLISINSSCNATIREF